MFVLDRMEKESLILKNITKHLKDQRKVDFSGYYASMILRRISKRIAHTSCADIEEYYYYLLNHDEELDQLIDILTINYSHFFRNPYLFEYMDSILIPELILGNVASKEKSIRIWSAACSTGEEAYSMAILIHDFVEKEKLDMDISIFATDIDKKSLQKAKKAIYNYDSIRNVKVSVLDRHFQKVNGSYRLNQEIVDTVHFSHFDMLNEDSMVPPDSIFGNFDMVLCRNMLIYFNPEHQERIFEKLTKSLKKNTYLILGETELVPGIYKYFFVQDNAYLKVFRKNKYLK